MKRLTIEMCDLKDKRVFIRVDFNVPIKEGRIKDPSRIDAAIPTINIALKKGASVILASHLGRPKGIPSKEFSLNIVFDYLKTIFRETSVKFAGDCIGNDVKRMAKDLKRGEILLLENLRFHEGETGGDETFAKNLASLADIYIIDSFGAAHRAHASISVMTKFFPYVASGLLMEKELHYLNDMLAEPEHPFIAILGGAKASDKIPVIEGIITKVDSVLLGGGMAYTFLSYLGNKVGNSLVDGGSVTRAGAILKRAKEINKNILLPVDHKIAISINGDDLQTTGGVDISDGYSGFDIGPQTIEIYRNEIRRAKTILWNGPMGVFEKPPFDTGTKAIAGETAGVKGVKIAGGGDSISAIKQMKLESSFSHLSTGGGASLEFLSGISLPGVQAISMVD